MLRNSMHKYGSISQSLHWLMALLIILMLALGLYMVNLPLSALKLKLYGWHKQIGVLILMLACVRLLWRWVNLIPPYPDHMPLWQKFAAHSVHVALYIFMFAMPITGWMLSSASGLPISFFGLFTLPDLIAPNEDLRPILVLTHRWLGYALIGALLAHIGAALQHHFIDKDDILRRMLP